MPVIKVKGGGAFKKTNKLLTKMLNNEIPIEKLRTYGELGVKALSEFTPKKTGETARHWKYDIVQTKHSLTITWSNDYAPYFVQIAILLQYGHATKSGGWVEGIDYINPALAPIFADLENELWKEVNKA